MKAPTRSIILTIIVLRAKLSNSLLTEDLTSVSHFSNEAFSQGFSTKRLSKLLEGN